MAEAKGYSFKLNPESEGELIALLSGKPTTYIIIEALRLYKRFEDAREQAVESALATLARPTISAEEYKKLTPVASSSNDDIQDFDL
jgi:hypothetical protein